jgi:hypothetical protein
MLNPGIRHLLLSFIFLLLLIFFAQCIPIAMPNFTLPFETNPNQTLAYPEIVACYEKMAAARPDVFQLTATGSTDSGHPLHVAVLSKDGEFDPVKIRQSGRRILLINNGIHPGEPEGIDATVLLLRDFLTKPEKMAQLEHLVIVVIPVYNVDGCINRGSFSRANQDGPEAYGFRGNNRNYDLNRDFVKTDSRNARTFNHIFTTWLPDVFVDNHTSNGADYQYTMTLIATQFAKLEAPLGQFLQQTMLPELYADMKNRGWEMIPYVDGFTEIPDGGIAGFVDYGRYSTGYAALWNTIGFMPETHMLKPFIDRMWSTHAFMESAVQFIHQHHEALGSVRASAWETTRNKPQFVLDWAMDTTRWDDIPFKGYAAKYKPSAVSGMPRLWYDRNEPFEKIIPYYNYFNPKVVVEKPYAYVIPQAWENVIERLRINGVEMHTLTENIELEAHFYTIDAFKNREAWEGHYFHHSIQTTTKTLKRTFYKGDVVVLLNQQANRYLLETLEPHAPDSWFAWNFFDPILMQKEYFSGYVFEDLAADYLREHPEVRTQLEQARAADPELAGSAQAQLDWVYRHSPWYEPTHRLYPVARLMDAQDLPIRN